MKPLDEIAVEVEAANADDEAIWAHAWAKAARNEGHTVEGLIGLLPFPGPELGIMEFDQSQVVLFVESRVGEQLVIKARPATDDEMAALKDRRQRLLDEIDDSATVRREAMARGEHPRL